MKKLLLFVCALVMLACAHSCKTVEQTAVAHDTLTVTRDSLVYIYQRDTLTITRNQDRDVIKYVYDTAQRVREVVKIEYHDRLKTEQGATNVIIQHDTMRVEAGTSTAEERHETPATEKTINKMYLSALVVFLFVLFVGTIRLLATIGNKNNK